jgi:hypothetical protein
MSDISPNSSIDATMLYPVYCYYVILPIWTKRGLIQLVAHVVSSLVQFQFHTVRPLPAATSRRRL